MATYYLSPIGVLIQQLSNSGQPLSGGQVFVYQAGTTTAQTNYTDSTGTVANPQPILLNSAGRLVNSIWLATNQPHKLILQDSVGNTLTTIDQLTAINDPISVTTSLANPASGSGADLVANAVKSYASFTTLRAAPVPTLAANQTLLVELLNGSGSGQPDNTAGTFAWVATSSATDDSINVIKPTAASGNGRYLRVTIPQPSISYADTGPANAITVTGVPGFNVLTDGWSVLAKIGHTTTNSAPTLSANASIAEPVYYDDEVTPLVAGANILNGTYNYIYNSTVTGWICTNPGPVTGSFTITLTGMSAGTTGTVNYRILPDGRTVYVWVSAAITGTSNTTAMTGTGVPAILTTTTSKVLTLRLEDNTVVQLGCLTTGTSTTWTFGSTVTNTTFTGSGTKGLPITAFSFTLD